MAVRRLGGTVARVITVSIYLRGRFVHVMLDMKMAAKSVWSKRLPAVVAVLGATGTGKSNLAVEIAKRFGGEVVSCDAMQVYTGLPIITNKIPADEQQSVQHHLMDFVDPTQRFTVVDYRNLALPIISSLLDRGKTAVIVGGTNYYVESILWDVLVSEKICNRSTTEQKAEKENGSSPENMGEYVQLSNERLHAKLAEVDPDMANILHPNNRRKIIRSLEVFEQTGRSHSEVLKMQHGADGASTLGGPLRFPHSCIFWLHCDQQVLDKRLDDRVDDMLRAGLVDELQQFHVRYNEQRLKDGNEVDYTEGIFQSIGFKEFHEYLILPETERSLPEGQRLLKNGIEALKLVTRRYSRRQIKWIKNRFIRRADRNVPPLFKLNATCYEEFQENAVLPALDAFQRFLEGDVSSDLRVELERNYTPDYSLRHCDTCGVFLLGDGQWQGHQRSKKHRSLLRKRTAECADEGASLVR